MTGGNVKTVAQMSSAGGGFKSCLSKLSYCALMPLTFYSHLFCLGPGCLIHALFSHTQPSCNLITPHLGLVKALGFIWPHWFTMFTTGFLQCEQREAERIVFWKNGKFFYFPGKVATRLNATNAKYCSASKRALF